MNTGIDPEIIRERYKRMSDSELKFLLRTDSHGLTPEAIEIAKKEVLKRGLNAELIADLDAQNKKYTASEISRYCLLVASLDCPHCSSNKIALNASNIAEVSSFIFYSRYRQKLVVGCPACLDKQNNSALAKTLILGWWQIPFGIIRTIQAIIINFRSRKSNHMQVPNEYLTNYVTVMVRHLEKHKDSKENLNYIISKEVSAG